jgi:DNA-3-methyladenine glycosylase II
LLYAFPGPDRFRRAEDTLLREAGLSAGKRATLRRVADALLAGILNDTMLEERTSAEAAELLCRIPGIGPWTAAVMLLRGCGRLDVFPGGDSSVLRNLVLVSGSRSVELSPVLHALSPQQGMLYYHLLLARLETQGEVARASAGDVTTPHLARGQWPHG